MSNTFLGISLSLVIYIGFALAAVAVKKKYKAQARKDEVYAAVVRTLEEKEQTQ